MIEMSCEKCKIFFLLERKKRKTLRQKPSWVWAKPMIYSRFCIIVFLHHKNFRGIKMETLDKQEWKKRIIKFLTAQTISLFGSSVVQYAIIWYITLTTSSGFMMTISTICGYVPQIIISLFAGAWLDRYDRKKMMMISDGIIAISTLAIAISFLFGYNNIWLLFIVLIIRSAGTGVQTPAVNAFIPQIVPQEHLMKINGINTTLTSLMAFLSPAVSGVILSLTSIETTFMIDVVTALIGICITFTIAVPKIAKSVDKTSTKSIIEDIKYGFSYLNENKFIKHQIYYIVIVAVLISPSAFLTPLLVSRAFGAEVWRLTVSEMMFSLGAVTGGTIIATWGGFRNRRLTMIAATIFYGIMMIGIGVSPIYYIYLLFNFLIGISMPCYNTPANVLLQENADPSMHGRVFSLVQIANACALPLGTIIFGPLADMISVQTILIINGAMVTIFAIISLKNKGFSKI